MQSCHLQWQVNFMCALTFLCFSSWNRLWPVVCVLSLLSVHAIGHVYLAVQMGLFGWLQGVAVLGYEDVFSSAAISEWCHPFLEGWGDWVLWWLLQQYVQVMLWNLISKRCGFVLVTWPWRLPEEWPEACSNLTVVGAGTMHGFQWW